MEEDFFAYASSKNGLPPAELVSDIIGCQLGGGKIKYWYYLTGKTSSLQICLRPPNGAPVSEQCYNGLSSTRAHQWAYNTVELPPFSKPMEIFFRAFYGAPDDSIALDDIVYDAILCGHTSILSSPSHQRHPRYASWSTIPIIDTEKWRSMKMKIEREGSQPPLMLIVAKDEMEEEKKLPEAEEVEKEENYKKELDKWEEENTYKEEERTTPIQKTTTTTIETTAATKATTEVEKTTPAQKSTTALALVTASDATTTDPEPNLLFGKSTTKISPTENLANFMAFFKQVAPILPAIPSMIKSFSPESALGLSSPARAAGVSTFPGTGGLTNFPSFGGTQNTGSEWKLFGEPLGSSNPENSISSLFGNSQTTENPVHFLAHGTPIKPINSQNRGLYTQSYEYNEDKPTATPRSSFVQDASTVYPPNSFGLKKNLHKISGKTRTSPTPMDLSQLTVSELKQLEAIHRKLFPNKSITEQSPSTNDKVQEKNKPPYLTRMLPGSSNTLPPVTSPPRNSDNYDNQDQNILDQDSYEPKPTQPPSLMVYEKSKFTTPKSLNGVNFGVGSNLTPEMVNELSMLREIPDLEELTEGLDLSLLNRPGGFSVLKQQFIERLVQRSANKLLNGRRRRMKSHRYSYL